MTVRLQLANAMMDCPQCWSNFVDYCQSLKDPDDRSWSLSDEEFEQALLPYHARATFEHDDNYVEFDTEQDMLVFVLRWS